MRLHVRPTDEQARLQFVQAGLHPLLARLYAARAVSSTDALKLDPARLIDPQQLTHVQHAAALLADALHAGKRLLIVADYDCDGATACAVGLRALRAMIHATGSTARVDYFVPDRFKLGYGLSPELVDIVAAQQPDVLITVDNGIASVEGVARANHYGITTLITDHHLPGAALPAAACIVNPNQPGCQFPSKHLAGVGVMFYVMLALRAELRHRNAFTHGEAPNLGRLTDLVALGTVADVVPLDHNNRILVAQGLKQLRSGQGNVGMQALLTIAGRATRTVSAFDFGFVMGPRLNAAGRLTDMGLGIECLITDDPARAANCAQALDQLNRERRRIESDMLDQALELTTVLPDTPAAGLALFHPEWHQGVVGILASRIKERLHRPVIAFARVTEGNEAGMLRGSGRSIPGLHLRDCLDRVVKHAPALVRRFGGHAQAAGLTIQESDFDAFAQAFALAADALLPEEARARQLDTDGALETAYWTLEVAQMLEAEIWGQSFPPPVFCDTFRVESQRIVGEKHLRLRLMCADRRIDAMRFNANDALPPRIRAAYRLGVNEFNGIRTPQLTIEYAEPA